MQIPQADPPRAGNNSATNIQPVLNHDSRMRLEAMMIAPAVESTCVTAAAYTNENSTRMKSNGCIVSARLC